jgi:hypothetical protein
VLDCRSALRLALLFLGALLARGRRTVTTWIRAAQLSDQFRSCYTAVAAAGKKADSIAGRLTLEAVKPLVGGANRLLLALDDTPTPRYGPHVQGAGVHHNPAPGPAGAPFVYGHVFVVLGLLATHPAWGTLALPLLARLYVRLKDLASIDPPHRPAFRTKLELVVELLRWAKLWLGLLGKPLWVVVDGAYAKAAFLKTAQAFGMTVFSRLRKNAALWSVPDPRPLGQRGRPRIYGAQRIERNQPGAIGFLHVTSLQTFPTRPGQEARTPLGLSSPLRQNGEWVTSTVGKRRATRHHHAARAGCRQTKPNEIAEGLLRTPGSPQGCGEPAAGWRRGLPDSFRRPDGVPQLTAGIRSPSIERASAREGPASRIGRGGEPPGGAGIPGETPR